MRAARVELGLAVALAAWPALALAAAPEAAKPGLAEIASFTFWKDVIPLFSVPLAVAAFFHSRSSDLAKAEREKRDELKAAIETLLDLRTQLEKAASAGMDEVQFNALSVRLNTRKFIYLQSAEELARSLPQVTQAEWSVLGYEHQLDSNFVHAEELYLRGVEASKSAAASTITRVAARRALASAQMAQGEAGQARGRVTYQESLDLLDGRKDPYSVYTRALTLRFWSSDEAGAGHLLLAVARLEEEAKVLSAISYWPMSQAEARDCTRALLYNADLLNRQNDLANCQRALDIADGVLGDWPDDPTRLLRGNIALHRAWLALARGADEAASEAQAQAAQQWYEAMAAANPARQAGLDAVAVLRRAQRPTP